MLGPAGVSQLANTDTDAEQEEAQLREPTDTTGEAQSGSGVDPLDVLQDPTPSVSNAIDGHYRKPHVFEVMRDLTPVVMTEIRAHTDN